MVEVQAQGFQGDSSASPVWHPFVLFLIIVRDGIP